MKSPIEIIDHVNVLMQTKPEGWEEELVALHSEIVDIVAHFGDARNLIRQHLKTALMQTGEKSIKVRSGRYGFQRGRVRKVFDDTSWRLAIIKNPELMELQNTAELYQLKLNEAQKEFWTEERGDPVFYIK